MKIIEAMNFARDAEEKIRKDMPYAAWTFFNSKELCLSGDQVGLAEGGDFKTLKEAREATAWLVSQLGGTVKWYGK